MIKELHEAEWPPLNGEKKLADFAKFGGPAEPTAPLACSSPANSKRVIVMRCLAIFPLLVSLRTVGNVGFSQFPRSDLYIPLACLLACFSEPLGDWVTERDTLFPLSLALSLSSSPRLKGRVKPPRRCGPPAFYGLLEGSEVR